MADNNFQCEIDGSTTCVNRVTARESNPDAFLCQFSWRSKVDWTTTVIFMESDNLPLFITLKCKIRVFLQVFLLSSVENKSMKAD